MLDPSAQALRPIPSLAWVPLLILWFGILGASKIVVISVGVFFPAYLPALRTVSRPGWMVDRQQLGEPDQIMAAIVVFALVGKLTDTLLVAAYAPLMRWQDVYDGD